MVISRKPIGAPGAAPAPGPGQLQRQDSWEIYSSDEDEPVVPKPPSNTNYQPYRPPDSYQPPPLQRGSYHPPPQTQPTASNETNGMDQIPDSLRPGGPRSQTNPFLRKKVPDSATQPPTQQLAQPPTQQLAQPPTQQLAQLNVQNTGSNPFQPQQPQKQDTTGSSNYDGTPNTVSSETNPWKTNQLDPNRTYSPASAAVLQESKGDAPPTILQSPVDMAANPWVDAPTSIPQAPAQPPPAPPQVPAQPPPAPPAPQIPQPVQPPQPPQPPQLESNPWSAGADIPAPPLPPSPAPPAPVAQPPTEPPAPPLPPSPQPPPKFEPPPAAPALLVPQAPPSQPSTPAYSDTNPFVHNGSPQPLRSQSRSPAMMSVASEGSGFVDVSQGKLPQTEQDTNASAASASNNGAWEGLDVLEQQQTGQSKAADSQIEEWKLVDVDGPSSSAAQEGESSQPPLPPRRQSGDRAGLVSPRPNVDPKTETYQVKNIKWHDPTSSQNPRVSPILVQNENGPCPLVALVNALTLTTPHDAGDSSLVEVLRSREQISLNLLLDAVFEELMSPRRSDEDAILPDVGELYAFLMSLHTGMNVNPRFMPTAAMREAFGRTTLTHLDTADRNSLIPGTFENTHEMGLYATFKIPLIHGWLPSTNDPAYSALERQAPSYEDAQNILFHEEELEHKLSSPQGLNGEEQQLYQDIMTIKGFLEDSATQLTAWGIQVIAKAIRPGTFAILFRNDHFSTLYCHPQSKELVTLVTDEGYRSNDEVVWESLVDIRGERTQYLSGDFRVVGQGASSTSGGLSDANAGEWQTVGSRRGGTQQQSASDEPPLTPAEQEDRDLALAMQLQEEEDQRHREDQDRRQREQNMSNQYIEQQGRGPQPRASSSQYPGNSPSRAQQLQSQGIAPNRRSSASSSLRPGSAVNQPRQTLPRQPSQNIRPMVPPRRHVPNTHRPEAAGADAPPPYEQAAHDEPFEPPLGHPAHATSTNASQQSVNAASVNTPPRIQRPAGQNIPPAFQGRPTAAGREGRDRDCVVM